MVICSRLPITLCICSFNPFGMLDNVRRDWIVVFLDDVKMMHRRAHNIRINAFLHLIKEHSSVSFANLCLFSSFFSLTHSHTHLRSFTHANPFAPLKCYIDIRLKRNLQILSNCRSTQMVLKNQMTERKKILVKLCIYFVWMRKTTIRFHR